MKQDFTILRLRLAQEFFKIPIHENNGNLERNMARKESTMILTNNSIPQFQNGLKGNTISDTELKYFAKARFIHFTTAHVFDIVYLQSQDRIHEHTAARAVSTCIWSRCVPDRIAVCGSDTQGRRTRTSARQETLHSEPDETFNEREG